MKNCPPELAMPLFIHESMHTDTVLGLKEEIIANAVETIFYLRKLCEMPFEDAEKLSSSNHYQAHLLNFYSGAMINSGQSNQSILGVKKSPGIDNIFPSNDDIKAESFCKLIERIYPNLPDIDSPGNGYLDIAISEFTGKEYKGLNFDEETIDILDSEIKCFTQDEMIKLFRLLKVSLFNE